MVFVEVTTQPKKAAKKPAILKLSSVTEVSTIPPTMGISESQTRRSNDFFHTSHCNATADPKYPSPFRTWKPYTPQHFLGYNIILTSFNKYANPNTKPEIFCITPTLKSTSLKCHYSNNDFIMRNGGSSTGWRNKGVWTIWFTCGGRCEGLDGLHEGNWNITQADVSKDDVDTKDKWHWENSSQTIMWTDFNKRLHLQHLDCYVGANCGTNEVHGGNSKWKLEVEFLIPSITGSLLVNHAIK